VTTCNEKASEIDFAPASIMAELREMAGTPAPNSLPDRLPVSQIMQKTELFQPRGLDERHIQELKRAIRVHGDLEPLTVMQVGTMAVLLDGHHRMTAYENSEVTKPVPVQYFEGTIEDAVLESGRANSKAKLPMTTWERQEYAWRLVLLNDYSKKKIREAAGVSDGQVANMRRVMKTLGNDAFDCQTWREAHDLYNKRERPELDDDDVERWLEAQANEYADRLSKAFGKKLPSNIDLAARAMNIYFGRKLPDLVRTLQEYVPDDPFDENADF